MKLWGKKIRVKRKARGKLRAYFGELFEGPGVVFTGVVAREVG